MSSKRIFVLTFALIWLGEVFSLIANYHAVLNTAIFLLIILATLILSLIKLEYGLAILTVELVIGSWGYIFAADPTSLNLSLRIGLFGVIMAVWLLRAIQTRKIYFLRSALKKTFFFLAAMVLIGLLMGFINKNALSNIFFDFNAWLFFLLLLPVYHCFGQNTPAQNQAMLKKLVVIIAAALSANILKSLTVLYILSHDFAGISWPIYKWVRDTRVGEMTYLGQNFWRVFFQSQIYSLLAIFPLLGLIIGWKKGQSAKALRLVWILAILCAASVLLSLSRSFWLAGIVGAIALSIFFILKSGWRLLPKIILTYLLISVFAISIVVAVVKFPVPAVPDNYSLLFSLVDRFKVAGESAVSTRWSMLPILVRAIAASPPPGLGILVGHGFGTSLSYKSSDPTILRSYPTGIFTTYAFEWGWLDIWLKIGLLGVVAYAILLVKLFLLAKKIPGDNQTLIYLGLAISVLVLALVNISTPYLNHPLGISFLVVLSAALESQIAVDSKKWYNFKQS